MHPGNASLRILRSALPRTAPAEVRECVRVGGWCDRIDSADLKKKGYFSPALFADSPRPGLCVSIMRVEERPAGPLNLFKQIIFIFGSHFAAWLDGRCTSPAVPYLALSVWLCHFL